MISSVHIYAFAAIAVQLMLFAVALIQCRKKKKNVAAPSPGPAQTNKTAPKASTNAPNPPVATANAPNPPPDSKPAGGGKKKEEPKKNSKEAKKAKSKEAKKGNKSKEDGGKTCKTEGQTDADDDYQEAGTVGTVANENTVDGNYVEAHDRFGGNKAGKNDGEKENSIYADGGKTNGSVKVVPKKPKSGTPSEDQDPFAKPKTVPKSKTEDGDQNVPSLYPKHA